MSELQMLILTGIIRVFSSTFLVSSNKKSIDRYLIKVLLISFLYSALLTIVLVVLMRPIVWGVSYVTGIDGYFELLLGLYLVGFVLAIFFIELKNNQLCLEGYYPDETIFWVTFKSHALSLTIMVLYVIL